MKITLLYQVSHYQGKKTKKYKELGPEKLPCYIQPLYNEVPLYHVYMEVYLHSRFVCKMHRIMYNLIKLKSFIEMSVFSRKELR